MQAYAELENDTPGTIYGLTKKSDGKSNTSSSFNNANIQSEREDVYEPHDRTGDEEYQMEKKTNFRIWKAMGAILVAFIAFQMFSKPNSALSTIMTDMYVKNQGVKTEFENRSISNR